MTTPPKTLSREDILNRRPLTKTVDIPSLGGPITVRQALTGDQEFVQTKIGDDTSINEVQVWLWIRCSVEPKFTDDDFYALIENTPTGALQEIDAAIEAAGGKVVDAKSAEKSPVA